MSVVFALRGDSLNARYSTAGNTPGLYGTAPPTVDATTGIYSSVLNLNQGSLGAHGLLYDGRNRGTARTISVLLRFRPGYTNAPSLEVALFSLFGGGSGFQPMLFDCRHRVSGPSLSMTITDNVNGTRLNNVALVAAWNPTAGTIYDLVVTWDGTNAANSLKMYIDASLAGQATPSGSWPATVDPKICGNIGIGVANAVANAFMMVDEFVIWNTVIDPTAVALNDTTSGSLVGAARTSGVSVSLFDGLLNSDPGAANVKNATNYIIAGTTITGTLVSTDPGASNVKNGTSYTIESSAKSGTLISTDPGISNVKTGIGYTVESSSKTGSLINTDPGVANVVTGTNYVINSVTLTGTLVEDGGSQFMGTHFGF